MVSSLSFFPRATDTYELTLVGLKRVPVYASTVTTPSGEDEPQTGQLVLGNFDVSFGDAPKKLFGRQIDEDIIKFMALYHKLDPIPRKSIIILTTQKRNSNLVDKAETLLSSIAPDSFYVRRHRGKPSIFITDKQLINELINTLGNRYTRKYPHWLIGSKYEKIFIEERMSDVLTPRKNSAEFTSSSINNPVLFRMLINQGYYVNIRKIEHSAAKKRELWYFTVYPTTGEHVEFITRETGITPKIRTKNIIDGKPYYEVRNVIPIK